MKQHQTTTAAGTYHDDLLPLPLFAVEQNTLALPDVTAGSNSSTELERRVMEHMPTVRFIARRIHSRVPQHVELDELISAGIVGLLDALQKFDGERQVQFKSYAQFRIRGAILDSLRTLDWSPRELRRKGRAMEEAMLALRSRLGRAPVEVEIAAELNMPLAEYQQILGELKNLEIGSLNVEVGGEAGDEELACIPGPRGDDPLLQCMKGELRERLMTLIESLPEKERLVLTLYYYEELTMKEIGLTLGVVESRISQIHSSAVLRLRAGFGASERKAQRPRQNPMIKH